MANEYIRKEWKGGTVRTTITGAINTTATSIALTDGSTFPSGTYPFVLVIDRGQSNEEKILVTSRTGNTLTVSQRGYDGSSAQSHTAGAYIEHTLDAYSIEQANAIAAIMTTQGDILYKTVTGDNTSYGRLAIGTSGYPLVSAGTAPAYQQLGQTGIASNAVTAAKVNSDVAGLGLVKNGTSLALDVNTDNSTLEVNADTVRVKDLGITNGKLAAGAVDDAKVSASAAIAFSKLAALSSAQILVGSGTNVATARTVGGDVTMSNTGSVTIANGVITKAKLSSSAGELGAAWTTFTAATARNTDVNISSLTMDGAYIVVGKTVHFRLNLSGTASAASSITVGLPTAIGTTVGFVQPANGLLTVSGINRATVSARIDGGVGARVQFYSDANGASFTAGTVNATFSGTFEVA